MVMLASGPVASGSKEGAWSVRLGCLGAKAQRFILPETLKSYHTRLEESRVAADYHMQILCNFHHYFWT